MSDEYVVALAHLRDVLGRILVPALDVEVALQVVLFIRSRRAQDILPARMEHVAERARREADQWESLMGAAMPACVRLREIADEAMELARMVRAGVEP